MKNRTLKVAGALIAGASVMLAQAAALHTHPTTLREGNARFQFLSPTLVRMEYSPWKSFVDAPTVVVVKRDWPPVNVETHHSGGWLIASTPAFTLRYKPDSAGFTPANLRIEWGKEGGGSWVPGQADPRNLGGLPHSLDGATKGKFPKFVPGILSRSGYFLLDDSQSPLEDSATRWIVPRTSEGSADLYFFVYGHDYLHALREYSTLCGKIPMIPRYALGAWATDLNYEYLPQSDMVRDHPYNYRNVQEIVQGFRREQIPVDVLVLDFAWHNYGWQGGYDWSPIFPDPPGFLSWAHAQGLKITLNDHPGYGGEAVLSDQDSHAAAIRKLLRMSEPRPPSITIDILRDWKFHLDSTGTGEVQGWHRVNFDDSGWKTIQAGREWEEQGYPDYDGYAWYRKLVVIPKAGAPLYAIFGGVDDEYDLYINGTLVSHHGTPGSSVYSTLTYTDIAASVKPGEQNLIVLRVNDWGGGGGMTRAPAEIADALPGVGIRFNLAEKDQATAFMEVLHNPLIDEGVNFWWVDGGSGSCDMNGLSPQLWTNRVFYDFTERHTGKRSLIFSRYGGWGDHRAPMFFTGDTHSEWEVLAEEVPFTACGGNVLAPFITHDIGGYAGKKLEFPLYARWVEFGAFSPVLRLHCEHENPEEGNLRLPWVYGDKGVDIARKMFQLRYRLLPYMYTVSREAYDEAVPLVRPLYLAYPELEAAYAHPDEYLFGPDMLVAPIVEDADGRDVYLPPGEWVEYFSEEHHQGEQVIHVKCPVDKIPVFVKAGSIIPGQTFSSYSDERPLDTLIVDVYGPAAGKSRLYEDDGLSLSYRKGKCAWTPMEFTGNEKSGYRFSVLPSKGIFDGQVSARSMIVRVHGIESVKSVRIRAGGKPVDPRRWSWDQTGGIVTVRTGKMSIRESVEVGIK